VIEKVTTVFSKGSTAITSPRVIGPATIGARTPPLFSNSTSVP